MIRLVYRTTLLLVVSLFASSCGTTSHQGPATHSVGKVAAPGEGYALFSMTFSGEPSVRNDVSVIPRFDAYLFRIRSKTDPFFFREVGVRANISSNYQQDFNVAYGMGFVFAEPLPAGEYELYGYELMLYEWGPYTSVGPSREAAISFTVKDGACSYLGRIECEHQYATLKPGLFDTLRPSSVAFDWKDFESEDLAFAYSKFPHILACDIRREPIGKEIAQLNVPANRSRK